jgi:hypothetical protein
MLLEECIDVEPFRDTDNALRFLSRLYIANLLLNPPCSILYVELTDK